MQERVESGQIKTYIEHQAVERFIINTHSIPQCASHARMFTALACCAHCPSCRPASQHLEIAKDLRSAQELKRAATKIRAAKKKNDGYRFLQSS